MPQPSDPIFVTIHLPASASLNRINATVKRYEETLGPLKAMNIDNDLTTLKFAATEPSPGDVAKVARQVDGKPKIPDGEELVTSGRIFIGGEQVLCAATRRKRPNT